MRNKINYSSYYERSTFSNVQQATGIKEGLVFYDTKERRVFPCDTKEENIYSTDSTLDEVVSPFLHECLSVCTRFSIGVEFFFHLLSNFTY